MKRGYTPAASTDARTTRDDRLQYRVRVVAVMVLGIGGPCAVCEIRGLCWEAWLGSIVIVAIALTLLRPSPSMWLAAVLVIGACGSVGLMGWSGWRFHSLNVFSSYSPRLIICGRAYQPEGPTRRRLPAPFKGLSQHVIGVTPSGGAILGAGCQTTVLFVESPGPLYRSYDLLGGP